MLGAKVVQLGVHSSDRAHSVVDGLDVVCEGAKNLEIHQGFLPKEVHGGASDSGQDTGQGEGLQHRWEARKCPLACNTPATRTQIHSRQERLRLGCESEY